MKHCPLCRKTYNDDQLNFCLEDGELLTGFASEPTHGRYADDSPPTVMLNDARRTKPQNWPSTASPPAPWQQQMPQSRPQAAPSFVQTRDQTLPTIALVLGLISIPLMCCYGGIWLGLPAAVIGFLGMRNADADPNKYRGRGMAVGGMVLGVITFFASIIFGIIALIASST